MTYVYLAQLGPGTTHYLGVSAKPDARVAALQTGNPDRVRLRLLVPGDRAVFSAIQTMLTYRKRGLRTSRRSMPRMFALSTDDIKILKRQLREGLPIAETPIEKP